MLRDKQLFGLCLAIFLLMLGDGMVLALLPQQVFSMTSSQLFVGYLASTYAVAQVMLQLPIGMLADRFGSKRFILLGYILSFAAGLLFYFTGSVSLIFGGRILQGIGEAPLLSLVPVWLSLQYSSNKGKAMGFYNASIYLGLTIGPLWRVRWLKEWSDNQVFLLYSILCFTGLAITHFSLKNATKIQVMVRNTSNLKEYFVFLKNQQTLVVLAGIVLYGAGFGIFMTVIPAFLLIVKHYDQSYVSIFFSLFYGAISLAQIVTGWLSDRLGRQAFMLIGMIMAAAGIGTASYFDHFVLIIILSIASFGLGTYYLASLAFLHEKASVSFRGAVSGVYYLFWVIGMFGGPLILAGYIQNNSYQAGFRIYSLMMTVQSVLLVILRLNCFRSAKKPD